MTKAMKALKRRFERRGLEIKAGKHKTKQSFKDDADINTIVNRHKKLQIPLPVRADLVFADFSAVPDLQAAFDFVSRAAESFYELPSNVREEFKNDPRRMISFLEKTDEASLERSYELGFRERPKATPTPQPAGAKGAMEPAGRSAKPSAKPKDAPISEEQ